MNRRQATAGDTQVGFMLGVGRVCHSAKWHDPFGRVGVHHKSFTLCDLRQFKGARLPNCQIANRPQLRSGLPRGARTVARIRARRLPDGAPSLPKAPPLPARKRT
jgi:hypothetical protein